MTSAVFFPSELFGLLPGPGLKPKYNRDLCFLKVSWADQVFNKYGTNIAVNAELQTVVRAPGYICEGFQV